MRLLVIGGTEFVGRHLVERALAGGHEVTVFHRGITEPAELPPVEHVHGDRDGGLEALPDRTWDAVIDVCGYVPRVVRASARRLTRTSDLYCFVSTESVYEEPMPPTVTETSPLATIGDPQSEDVDAFYGPLKVLCEQEVVATFGAERALIVRPGYIVGPHDSTDRFTYWVRRMARGGDVLAPGVPETPLQCIDARDLAAFTLDHVERGTADVFNVDGPPVSWAEFLETCQRVAGSGASITWAPEAWLLERGLTNDALPLWEPGSETLIDLAKPLAAGLTHRAFERTVRDTLAWDRTRGLPEMTAGLNAELETGLLSALLG